MPEIGEIRRAEEIGYKSKGSKYIWAACEACGKERWVCFKKGKPEQKRCLSCGMKLSQNTKGKLRGSNHSVWKGGKYKCYDGYLRVWLHPDDFYYPMTDHKGYVLEHRLVIAKSLNRCLLKTEHVHHKDGIRDHNELSNLELVSPANHTLRSGLCANCELRKEIRLLRWQVKELTQALQEKLEIGLAEIAANVR